MSQRYSDAYNIVKKDIRKSVIKKYYKDFCEYWIYRERKSRFVDTFGKKLDMGEKYLYCIIVCQKEGDGIRQQNEQYIAVDGVKFDNGDSKDLDDYLSKTGRGTDVH